MSATMLVEDLPVLEKPKRTRKTHNKVRTGCLTCKYVEACPTCVPEGEIFSLTLLGATTESEGRNATKRNRTVADVPVRAANATAIPHNNRHRRIRPWTTRGPHRARSCQKLVPTSDSDRRRTPSSAKVRWRFLQFQPNRIENRPSARMTNS